MGSYLQQALRLHGVTLGMEPWLVSRASLRYLTGQGTAGLPPLLMKTAGEGEGKVKYKGLLWDLTM